MLAIVAGATSTQFGIPISNAAVFQGALYAVNDYQLTNLAMDMGPVVARQLSLTNLNIAVNLKVMPPGTPGVSIGASPIAGSWSG